MSDISGLVGKVDFTVRHLSSSTSSFPSSWNFNSGQQCVTSGSRQVLLFPLVVQSFAGFAAFISMLLPFLILVIHICPKNSVLHTLPVLQQRKPGPCVLPFRNMLWLLQLLLDLCFLL